GYGEKNLFSGLNLMVEGGERIAIIGDNGTGKSTLIKTIVGEEMPDEGRIRQGPSVRAAYLPQIIRFDVPERNLVDTMLYAKKDMTPQSARNRLAAYKFQGEDVFKSVSVLSGGEQSRLRLCMLMDEEINLLILDEPTNHLDIDSREWIEEAVEAYDGALLFVSHDRYFIQRFATRIWELENGVITDYPMGFERYRQIKAEQAKNAPRAEVKEKEKKTEAQPRVRSNKNAYAAKKQLAICEREIGKAEEKITALEQDMETYACDAEKLNEIYEAKLRAEEELEQLMERWAELAEEAGE
ncbi:MAG: ABC-F family ATP-binding cassette domain-containing protein, partial [Oscillospiraceae bacterium]|nr:ABC-F family ATP-binding cassette domain-containing protein [Oscillospiraceae bacterium]